MSYQRSAVNDTVIEDLFDTAFRFGDYSGNAVAIFHHFLLELRHVVPMTTFERAATKAKRNHVLSKFRYAEMKAARDARKERGGL